MLIGRGIYYGQRGGLLGGSRVGAVRAQRPVWNPADFRRTFDGDRVSFPVGYHQSAIVLPMKVGGIACYLRGSGGVAASVAGVASLTCNLSGAGSLTATGAKGRNLICSMAGTGTLTSGIQAKGWIRCSIQIGAQPSAFDIAQAVLNATASQYNIPGTIGNKINSASAAGDPWTAELPGSYPPGTAGNIVGTSSVGEGLTVGQFLGLK